MAENLVILHTNDMHSNVRPEQLTKPGGMVRVKAAVDSIRRAKPYVMLLDAGETCRDRCISRCSKARWNMK